MTESNTNVDANSAKAIIDFAKDQAGFQLLKVEDPCEPDRSVPFAVLPTGKRIESLKPILDSFLDAPVRREGRAALRTLDAFVAHANRFKDEHSALFAEPNQSQPRITSVIDYHAPGATGRARWGKHRGMYDFPLSEQWQAWKQIDGKQLETIVFAEFLENRVEDVVDPSGLQQDGPTRLLADKLGLALASPSSVMAASRGLSIHVSHDVQEHRVLETGEVTLNFTEKHEPKGATKVPAAFAIAIPVFQSGALFHVAVRLRYRVQGSRISWICSLYRTDRVFDQAFTEACTKAQKETALPLFYGTPE